MNKKISTGLDNLAKIEKATDKIRRSFPNNALSGIDNPAFLALDKLRLEASAITRFTNPAKDIRVAANLARTQHTDSFATLHKNIAAFQMNFEHPTSKLLAAIQKDLGAVTALQKVAQRYALQNASIVEAMRSMHTPWLDALKINQSLTGFATLQGIGKSLSSPNGFDIRISDLIRSDLGDWRDKITWKSINLESLPERRILYQDLGFNSDLTDLPDEAFDEAVEIVDLDECAPVLIETFGDPLGQLDGGYDGLDRTNFAHRWLFCLESQIRKFIDLNMRFAFGVNWPNHQLPNGIYDQWLDRQRKKELTSRSKHPIIAYSDFTDYERVITRKDNWDQVFRPIFHRPENVRETFQRLYPIRLDTMHARIITKEDILLLYAESTRLVRLFGSFRETH